jgi:hypothetical protein
MTNYRAIIVAFIFGAILSAFVAGSFLPISHGQDASQMSGQIQIVAYASGLTGLFDRNTGMLYVYDANLDKCVMIRQCVQLGEPMRKLRD